MGGFFVAFRFFPLPCAQLDLGDEGLGRPPYRLLSTGLGSIDFRFRFNRPSAQLWARCEVVFRRSAEQNNRNAGWASGLG